MKYLILGLLLMASGSAFADVRIACGEFLIVSEEGQVPQVYDANNKLIRGAAISVGENQGLVLTITHAQSTTGPVGLRYNIADYHGQSSVTAEKFIMGGFTGGLHRGTLQCAVSEL